MGFENVGDWGDVKDYGFGRGFFKRHGTGGSYIAGAFSPIR
jgi:hypothetical protein